MADAASRMTTMATTKATTTTMKAPAQASTVPLVPLSALSKANSAQQKPPLSTIIQRIHKQQGHFRNVTEAALLEQIRADTEAAAAAERRQREERERENGEEGGASSDDVSGAGGRVKRGREEEGGEDGGTPAKKPALEAGDEAGRRELLQSAKEEIMRQVGQAYMEAYYALDFVSLLLSKELPRQAEQTLSQHLKQFVPPGSLGLVRVQEPPLQHSAAAEQDRELVRTGWKIQSLNATADTLMAAAARLTSEIEHETRYWQEVLAVHQKGWPLCRMPRERHTLGVNFGFMEAAADFRDRSLAALRRGVDGRIVLDQAPFSASARDGKPRALRVRIGCRGSSSSSTRRPLIAIVGSSSAPMPMSTISSTSSSSSSSSSSSLSSVAHKGKYRDNDDPDKHQLDNGEDAKVDDVVTDTTHRDEQTQSDNNGPDNNAAASTSSPPVEDLIVQARNAIFEEELFHELAREARTLTNRGVRSRDATIILPLPRAPPPPQQSRQAQPSQRPPSSMPTFRLPFNRPSASAPEDDEEEYILLDMLPLEEFPVPTTADKRNVAQAPTGEAGQQGSGGEQRKEERRRGKDVQRQNGGEGEIREEGHNKEDEEQEQEATFLAEGIALTLRILLARAHQLNLQRRSQPPPPLRAPDRAIAPAVGRGGLALLPPPPPPPYAILRPVLARLSAPFAAPAPASLADPPAPPALPATSSSSGVPNISVSAQQPSAPSQQAAASSSTATSAPSDPSAPPAPSASQTHTHAQSSTNSGQRQQHHHSHHHGRQRHRSRYTHHYEQLLLSLLSLMKSLTTSSSSSHPH